MNNNNLPSMTIMRGLPGSGKSTTAKQLAAENDAVICSADDFFINHEGVYVFNPDKLHMAHSACQAKAVRSLNEGKNVIIDNTNIKLKELNTYFNIAKVLGGIEVRIAMSSAPWATDVDECAKRNTHGVPRDVIQRMKDSWYNMTGNEYHNLKV